MGRFRRIRLETLWLRSVQVLAKYSAFSEDEVKKLLVDAILPIRVYAIRSTHSPRS